jgi:hypothetical protein
VPAESAGLVALVVLCAVAPSDVAGRGTAHHFHAERGNGH